MLEPGNGVAWGALGPGEWERSLLKESLFVALLSGTKTTAGWDPSRPKPALQRGNISGHGGLHRP